MLIVFVTVVLNWDYLLMILLLCCIKIVQQYIVMKAIISKLILLM